MIKDIKGLHHITSMASDAQENNRFFTDTLGLRRVKKTVNFDDPSVYHLYYGDEAGTPGTVMTYFPFPNMMTSRPGVGEVGETQFAIPKGTLSFWKDRFLVRKRRLLAKALARSITSPLRSKTAKSSLRSARR
jgi:glyoxalase family protein